jgi:serine/threonine protein kinase
MLCEPMASGGMGSVHLGRLFGPAGFARTVAIKKPHKHLAEDPQTLAMFLDEARLVARIRHVNVVPTLEVIAEGEELYLVMEYVPGVSLAALLRALHARELGLPVAVAAAIVCGMLRGLHAAHEARSEAGEPLGIVHRDVSPANVIVGADGIARVLDFGVAKATNRLSVTPGMALKGKLSYMAPEYLTHGTVTPASDLFSAGVVLWECLTVKRLFFASNSAATLQRIMDLDVPVPSQVARDSKRSEDELGRVARLDAVVTRALRREISERYATALEMVSAIEQAVLPASADDVAKLLKASVPDLLAQRAELVARVETTSASPDGESNTASPAIDEPSTTHLMTKGPGVPLPRKRLLIAAASLLGITIAAFVIARATRASTVHAASPREAPPPIEAPSMPPSVAPPVETAASSSTPGPSRHTPAAGGVRVTGPAANCDPPFIWDNGVKKFRPECFRGKPR